MKKNKGFTLIELLAVIVILAIIALIAVPIVLNIINNSKEESNVRSAELYLEAAEQGVMTYQMNNTGTVVTGEYKVMENGNLCNGTINSDKTCTGIKIKVSLKGDKIMPEKITFGENGKITSVTGLTINGNNYTYSNGSLVKEESKSEAPTTTTVYRVSEDEIIIGDTINPTDYTTDPSTLGKSYYLKHVLDKDNKVTDSYVCAKYNNKEYCLTSGESGYAENEADYTGNVLILKGWKNEGFSCDIDEVASFCAFGSDYLYVNTEGGSVWINSGEADCYVNEYEGLSYCVIY